MNQINVLKLSEKAIEIAEELHYGVSPLFDSIPTDDSQQEKIRKEHEEHLRKVRAFLNSIRAKESEKPGTLKVSYLPAQRVSTQVNRSLKDVTEKALNGDMGHTWKHVFKGSRDNHKSNGFYDSREWRELRYQAFRRYGFACMACGRDKGDGIKLHVDHIKPRSKYPELELDINNLQVLCEDCNIGKSNKFEDDLR